jgi:hypothetical protein
VLPDGELRLQSADQLVALGNGWTVRGRLKAPGLRFIAFPPIEIQIVPWSDAASELRIIPQTPFTRWWGVRRERRYTHLASAAADGLISLAAAEASTQADRHASQPRPTFAKFAG